MATNAVPFVLNYEGSCYTRYDELLNESSNSSTSDSNSDLLGNTLECTIINNNDSLISNVGSDHIYCSNDLLLMESPLKLPVNSDFSDVLLHNDPFLGSGKLVTDITRSPSSVSTLDLGQLISTIPKLNQRCEKLERLYTSEKEENAILQNNYAALNDNFVKLQQEFHTFRKKTEIGLNDGNQYSRKNSLLVKGLKNVPRRAHGRKFSRFVARELKKLLPFINITVHDIDCSHILYYDGSKSKPVIIVKFISRDLRNLFYKNNYRILHSQIYFSEHLTQENLKLLHNVKVASNGNAWSDQCKIFAVLDGKKKKIDMETVLPDAELNSTVVPSAPVSEPNNEIPSFNSVPPSTSSASEVTDSPDQADGKKKQAHTHYSRIKQSTPNRKKKQPVFRNGTRRQNYTDSVLLNYSSHYLGNQNFDFNTFSPSNMSSGPIGWPHLQSQPANVFTPFLGPGEYYPHGDNSNDNIGNSHKYSPRHQPYSYLHKRPNSC